jgi:hypothetical protein
MMHNNRVWCVVPVETAQELAEKLTQYSWCCCNGFELENYLWLNDATGADGAQEYACVRKPAAKDPHYRQVESITASWCTTQQMLQYIREIQDGIKSVPLAPTQVVVTRSATEYLAALGAKQLSRSHIVHPRLETPQQHGRCAHCA